MAAPRHRAYCMERAHLPTCCFAEAILGSRGGRRGSITPRLCWHDGEGNGAQAGGMGWGGDMIWAL